MAYIGTDSTRICQSHLGIHVSTVHIELTTTSVNDFAHLFDVCFKDTVSRRICNHGSCQMILVGFCFRSEVFQVDVTMLVTFHCNSCKAALDCAGRVCSVCRSWQKDNVSFSLTDAFQISMDYTQTCIFSGSTRIRLKCTSLESGDFA